jgi:hypothetical protein
MPVEQTHTRALEAAGAVKTGALEAVKAGPAKAATVTRKGPEPMQRVAEQAARAAQTTVQQAGQNLDLALQLTGTAVSSSQAVQSTLAEHVQQAVQRTLDALTQASKVRSPTALLDLQNSYVTDSLQAVLVTNARLAEIAANVAQQAADKLQHRAA